MGDLVLKGATSGQITVTPTAVAGTNTLTLPAVTGTVVTTGSTGVVSGAMLSTGGPTWDSSGNVTATGTVVMGSSFKRNRLINGNMQVWQRGTSNTSINNSPAYVSDRWYGFVAASVTEEQIIQSTDVPSGFQYSAKWGRPSSTTNANSIWFCQNIESVNMLDTVGQYVTLSFYAKKGANYSGGNMTVRVATGTTADQSAATFSGGPATGYTGYAAVIDTTQALTTSWVRYTFTSAGTVASNALEMAVAFGFTPNGTASTDDNIYITGVQLEVGSVATPYERQIYSDQLAQCWRYCYKLYPDSSSTNPFFFESKCLTGTNALAGLTFPQRMRAVPSLTFEGAASNYGMYLTTTGAYLTVTSFSINTVTTSTFGLVNLNFGSATTANVSGWLTGLSQNSFGIRWEAEL